MRKQLVALLWAMLSSGVFHPERREPGHDLATFWSGRLVGRPRRGGAPGLGSRTTRRRRCLRLRAAQRPLTCSWCGAPAGPLMSTEKVDAALDALLVEGAVPFVGTEIGEEGTCFDTGESTKNPEDGFALRTNHGFFVAPLGGAAIEDGGALPIASAEPLEDGTVAWLGSSRRADVDLSALCLSCAAPLAWVCAGAWLCGHCLRWMSIDDGEADTCSSGPMSSDARQGDGNANSLGLVYEAMQLGVWTRFDELIRRLRHQLTADDVYEALEIWQDLKVVTVEGESARRIL
mmetsp:Transcript_93599/g.292757  ORF Transcript_93599/g.292757 Transcript_93599/m.292757 type:complete len:290 (+) Transcript_93599:89-958(+)